MVPVERFKNREVISVAREQFKGAYTGDKALTMPPWVNYCLYHPTWKVRAFIVLRVWW